MSVQNMPRHEFKCAGEKMILGLARFAQFYTLINTVFSHSEHIVKLTEEWLW